MAIKYMTRQDNPIASPYSKNKNHDVYHYEETILTTATGDTVVIPVENNVVLGKVICSTSSGKIQTTISSMAKVLAGTADWDDWDSGVVAITTIDESTRVNAIRGVSAAGTIVLEVSSYRK